MESLTVTKIIITHIVDINPIPVKCILCSSTKTILCV